MLYRLVKVALFVSPLVHFQCSDEETTTTTTTTKSTPSASQGEDSSEQNSGQKNQQQNNQQNNQQQNNQQNNQQQNNQQNNPGNNNPGHNNPGQNNQQQTQQQQHQRVDATSCFIKDSQQNIVELKATAPNRFAAQVQCREADKTSAVSLAPIPFFFDESKCGVDGATAVQFDPKKHCSSSCTLVYNDSKPPSYAAIANNTTIELSKCQQLSAGLSVGAKPMVTCQKKDPIDVIALKHCKV